MTGDPRDTTRLREAFRAEVKRATRATAVAGGLIAILAVKPPWAKSAEFSLTEIGILASCRSWGSG